MLNIKIPKTIPIIAVVIIAAICFANKDEISEMFSKDTDPIVCELCDDDCDCHGESKVCDCDNDCECPICVE